MEAPAVDPETARGVAGPVCDGARTGVDQDHGGGLGCMVRNVTRWAINPR